MIQDIFPYKLHNEFRPEAKPTNDSPLLIFSGHTILGRQDDNTPKGVLEFPTYKELTSAFTIPSEDLVFAFAIDDTEYFLYIGEESFDVNGYDYLNLHLIRSKTDNVYGMIMYTGFHLFQWYDVSRYCGKCSAKTAHSQTERALKCPDCGKTIYPRLMPAVIVGVTDGDKLLVSKYKEGFNHYALIAGFTEIGETFEECVAREVMEEAGLKVKNIRYAGSQPWGLAQDILAGFYCDVDGSNKISLDTNELKLAEWKSRAEIELQPDSYSLTNDMMRRFKEGRNN